MSETITHDGKTYTLLDMRNWFLQIRKFRTILSFGSGKNRISGEGQAGGRYVTDFVKSVEFEFVTKLGEKDYIFSMDKLMKEVDLNEW